MTVIGTERQMFAVGANAVLVEQTADLVQQGFIQRRWAAERQREAVADEWITFGESAEGLAELAADVDPVLRRDLKKIDRCVGRFPQRAQQGPPQAKSCADGLAGTLL